MAKPAIVRCPTCGRRKKRSSNANRYYWALLHEISESIKPEGKQYSSEQWHLWAKSKFLGAEEVKLPSGKTLIIPHSTSDLETDEFGTYLDRLQAWAASRGVFLELDA